VINYSATFANIVSENFAFKSSPIEMAENLEWKNLKPIFLKTPQVLSHDGKVFHRLNPIETANSIASANIKDRELKSDENHGQLNVLDVIAKKLVKEQCKLVEEPINPHDRQQTIEVKCEGLKSIFTEHDGDTTTDAATDARVKSEQGFVLSHLKPMANIETNDCEPTDNQSVNKPLISEDVFKDWISSSVSISTARDNPLDRGIFPQTPSLSKSSKKIKKKVHPNTTHFLQ
jgi:hypothetical protein